MILTSVRVQVVSVGEQLKDGKTEPVIVIKLPVPDKPDTYTHQRMQPKHIAKLGADVSSDACAQPIL